MLNSAHGRVAIGSRQGRSPSPPKLPPTCPAREALLDRAMGPGRKRKSSEKLRRGRKPSEGLAFVARDADGRGRRHGEAVGRGRGLGSPARCCSGRSPSIRR